MVTGSLKAARDSLAARDFFPMSATAPSQADIRQYLEQRQDRADDCPVCEEEFPIKQAVHGSYCSLSCADDHKREKAARNVLETIRKDHRYCTTCFRRTKEIESPPDPRDYPDVVCGFQYPTPEATEVWRDTRGRQKTGLGCTCGNCQHSHDESLLRNRERIVATYNLTEAVAELRAEDKLDVRVDREQLFDAVIDVGAIRPALEVAIER